MNVKVNKKNGIRLKTKNKLLKEDIVITTGDELVQPEGNIEIKSAVKEYNVANYKTAQIVSDTLLPENIIKGVNILGVSGSFDISPYENEIYRYKNNLWKFSLNGDTVYVYKAIEESDLEGLTSLRDYAFAYTYFYSINLPNTIKKLGVGCFEWCKKLKSVKLSPNITEIPERCFKQCRELTTKFIFSEGLTSIGDEAFTSCFEIPKIVLPASLNHIGGDAFMYANAASIYFKGATPPAEVGGRCLTNIKNVYVPTGSLAAYQEAFVNSFFKGTWHEMDPEDMK